MRSRGTWVGFLVASILLAGCGGAPAAGSSPGASPTPTATLAPTPLPTANAAQAEAACHWTRDQAAGAVQVGDLFISAVGFGNVVYSAELLPDDLSHKPYQVQTPVSLGPGVVGPSVNPNAGEHSGFFGVAVCNGSGTQAHVIRGTSVLIDTLTPHDGQVNAWKACDAAYVSPQLTGGGAGCGGLYVGEEYLHATFADGAAAGTVVTATPTGVATYPGAHGPLPVTIAPGSTLELSTGLTMPAAPATYTFSLGIDMDSGAPIWLPLSWQILFAANARVWSGKACAAPAMASQIPAPTNPPSYYVCPNA